MNKKITMVSLVVSLAFVFSACAGNSGNVVTQVNNGPVENNQVVNENANTVVENNVEENAVDPEEEVAPTKEVVVDSDTFMLVAEESEARFNIKEVLNGSDKLVIGVTNAVSGTITVDLADPAAVSVSVIEINLTNIETDNGFRNNAIAIAILQTGTYKTTTFAPLEYLGLPDSVAVGDTFSFQIRGNLTIKQVTLEEVVDVSVTIVSETRIEGLASVVISHDEYGASILRLPPQVGSVAETTLLELAFVAQK